MKSIRQSSKTLLSHTALIFILFSSMGKAADLVYFDIKQQNANQSLILFGKQSQQTILFSFVLTKNIQTNQVKGYYTVDFAIHKLLRKSGLKVVKNQDNVIAISAVKKVNLQP